MESVRLDQPYRPSGPAFLLNPRRLELVLAAAAYPGIHLRSASRLLLSPLPSLRFHVRRLVDRGLLKTRAFQGRLLLFVPGMYPRTHELLLGVWADPFDRRVLTMIRDHPGLSRAEIARGVLANAATLGQSLRRLRASGAVRSHGPRSDPKFTMTKAWAAFETSCREAIPQRTECFVSLLAGEGLHPFIEEATADRIRLSVDGPRFRVRFALPLDPLQTSGSA